MVFQNIMMGASGQSTGYSINQSIRFNTGDSPFLTRTPDSASNRRTWTYSVWWKLNTLASSTSGGYRILQAGSTEFGWSDGDDKMYFIDGSILRATTQVFHDPTAWQHIVLAVDTTDGTAADRVAIYINGVEVTSFSTSNNPDQNFEFDVNAAEAQNIGKEGSNFIDAYIAEIYLIDGTKAAPTAFGEFDANGVWVPIEYAGSFGTNGFHIDGRDSSDLGDDESGNGNDFTSSGLTAADQVADSPTENYCTWNAVDAGSGTLSEGNTVLTGSSDRSGTFGMSSGKWAWKITTAASTAFGVVQGSLTGTESTYTATSGEVLEFEFNADTGVLEKSVDGASYSGVATGLTSGPYFPLAKGACTADFGASGFTVDDSTFKYLNTSNLAAPAVTDGSEYFHTQLYTGNGSSGLAITNDANFGDFKPDLLWIAPRSNGDNHVFWDVARAVTSRLKSNSNAAQDTDSTALVTFESDGFDLDTTDANFNGSGRTYVGWQWHTQGAAGSSNTDGSINTATTSVSQEAGFSISTYTGTGSNATVGHGIGVAPTVLWIKRRDSSADWAVYHVGLASTSKFLKLNSNSAEGSSSAYWNTTAPSSTVFSIGTDASVNASSGTYVAYSFAEVAGYSRFEKYTGNGNNDGPFINTGFRPAWIMVKEHTSSDDWVIYDSTRDPINLAGRVLRADSTAAEFDGRGTSDRAMDMLSNGFKFRSSNATMNGNGVGYVYMAFAENPFGGDGVAPATAR